MPKLAWIALGVIAIATIVLTVLMALAAGIGPTLLLVGLCLMFSAVVTIYCRKKENPQ